MQNALLLATNNKNKLRELKTLLSASGIQLYSPADLDLYTKPEENGSTYFENAAKKAKEYYQMSGLPTLADDSGLEVEVLDGKPGLHSNRIGTLSDATDAERRKYLLTLLKNKPKPWKATFHCEIVFIGDEETIYNFHGSCHGLIIEEEKGQNGFGYDPIFYFPELNATMAELSESQKNQISHRANAIKEAIPLLSSFFKVNYQ